MPKRKSPYPEKPWTADPVKWGKLLEKKKDDTLKQGTPTEPKGGWMLYRWDTLEDVPKIEKS